MSLETNFRELPGGLEIKNQPSNAGDLGSIPGKGTKTPQAWGQPRLLKTGREASALQQLSLCTTARASQPLKPRFPREALALQLEKLLRATTKTQCSQNKREKLIISEAFISKHSITLFVLYTNVFPFSMNYSL